MPGYDETSDRTLGRKRPDLTTMRLCRHLVSNLLIIYSSTAADKKRATDRRNTQNYPGERRRENSELAYIAEPISSHKAYPRGLWLREVSVGSKLCRSQVLTDQGQAEQKGQQGLLSTRKETHVRSKMGTSRTRCAWSGASPSLGHTRLR